MTGTQVAEQLLISQAKVSPVETHRRAVSPRDLRDLCMLYGVTDLHAVDSLTALARESSRQVWWHSYGGIPPQRPPRPGGGRPLRSHLRARGDPRPAADPQLRRHGHRGTIPLVMVEQAAARLKVRLRRQ